MLSSTGRATTYPETCDATAVIWASTCASSVETLPVQMYQSTSKASRSAINANFTSRGRLRIAARAVAGKDGVVSDAGVDCGGGAGGGVGAGSIELINAIFPRRFLYLAYVFCTSPISWDRFTLDWLKRLSLPLFGRHLIDRNLDVTAKRTEI